jgi:putative sugar O-methyltransferase
MTARVLEIGAGYGRTAYALCSLFPTIQYFIFDVPPALAVSQNYLASVFGEDAVARWDEQRPSSRSRRLNFSLPDELSRIEDGFFDLALNLSSFDEMPSRISAGYLQEFDRVVDGVVYLNGYPVTSHRGDDRLGLDELTYPQRWNEVYSGPHPVASTFVEKLFEVRRLRDSL